jgi:hypothetical protein
MQITSACAHMLIVAQLFPSLHNLCKKMRYLL